MKAQQTSNTEIIAFLCPTPGLSMPMQEKIAADAKAKRIFRHGPIDTGGLRPRDRWLSVLRAGDTALLPSVRCLVIPSKDRPEGYKPFADFCRSLNLLLATGVIIVDVRARITSEDPETWANHVYSEGQRIAAGLRPEHVRQRAYKAAQAVRLPGIKARWHAPAMAEQLERQRVIWSGAGNLQRVVKQLDPELRGCSSRTLYDILGPRRPDDPGAGGRGKTRGSK